MSFHISHVISNNIKFEAAVDASKAFYSSNYLLHTWALSSELPSYCNTIKHNAYTNICNFFTAAGGAGTCCCPAGGAGTYCCPAGGAGTYCCLSTYNG